MKQKEERSEGKEIIEQKSNGGEREGKREPPAVEYVYTCAKVRRKERRECK